MADKEKVIKEWEAVLSRDPLDAPWDLIDDTLALLKEQETVVRCKDCRQGVERYKGDAMLCNATGRYHGLDWFCADGERVET